jgi:hypothetical protein
VAAIPLEKHWERRRNYRQAFHSSECGALLRSSHRAAIAAQQSCIINDDKILIERDGMRKTVVWKKTVAWKKKCAPLGNFAYAETFPLGHAGANRTGGFFVDPR